MLRHHFMARVDRLQRVIERAQAKVESLAADPSNDRTTRRSSDDGRACIGQ
jgi:hypothetical protein